MRHFALSLLLALAATGSMLGQGVLVAPHVVVLDHRARSAAMTLYNPGPEAAEVSISTFFGYPVTDSVGEFSLLTPNLDPSLPSAAGWVDAYPKRMTLGPLERQTVRLLARPPADLPDGEYWSRIMISAKGGKAPLIAVDSASPGIEVGLNLEVRTVLPLQYRKGAVATGVTLDSIRAGRVGDSLVVRAKMIRTGNAAFVGTARGSLVDGAKRIVGSFAVPLAVYREIDPRLAMPIAGVLAGHYRLELVLVSDRTDLPPEQLVQAAPVKSAIELDLP